MMIRITNCNSESKSIQIYQTGEVVNIEPNKHIDIETKSVRERDFYNSLLNKGFSIEVKGEILRAVASTSSRVLPTIRPRMSPITHDQSPYEAGVDLANNSDFSAEVDVPVHLESTKADAVLDEALSEVTKPYEDETSQLDNVGVITDSSDERELDNLEAWEYKAILKDLGVESKARSVDTLLSLVQSSIPADYDWRSVIKQ